MPLSIDVSIYGIPTKATGKMVPSSAECPRALHLFLCLRPVSLMMTKLTTLILVLFSWIDVNKTETTNFSHQS